jgi:glycosyltransferase involved in cell wall biosynthesis
MGLQNVQFDDAVPKSKIFKVLQEADAFLMLLKDSPVFQWGVSPNKLFDYMMSARPIIYGVRSRFNPVAEAQAGLTIPPEDTPSLAKAILSMADLAPQDRWSMGMKGRQYVEQHFDLRQISRNLEEAMLSLAYHHQPATSRLVRTG